MKSGVKKRIYRYTGGVFYAWKINVCLDTTNWFPVMLATSQLWLSDKVFGLYRDDGQPLSQALVMLLLRVSLLDLFESRYTLNNQPVKVSAYYMVLFNSDLLY